MRKTLFIFLLLTRLADFTSPVRAQTVPVVGEKPAPLNIVGYPGNSFTAVVNFPAAAPADLSAAVYQLGTTAKLSGRQPTVTLNGNQAIIIFPFPNSNVGWDGWVEIDWINGHRIAGRVVVNRQPVPGRITSQTFTVGTSQPVSVTVTTPQAGEVAALAASIYLDVTVATYAAMITWIAANPGKSAIVTVTTDTVNNGGGEGSYKVKNNTIKELFVL